MPPVDPEAVAQEHLTRGDGLIAQRRFPDAIDAVVDAILVLGDRKGSLPIVARARLLLPLCEVGLQQDAEEVFEEAEDLCMQSEPGSFFLLATETAQAGLPKLALRALAHHYQQAGGIPIDRASADESLASATHPPAWPQEAPALLHAFTAWRDYRHERARALHSVLPLANSDAL
jgi:hypothetical protein